MMYIFIMFSCTYFDKKPRRLWDALESSVKCSNSYRDVTGVVCNDFMGQESSQKPEIITTPQKILQSIIKSFTVLRAVTSQILEIFVQYWQNHISKSTGTFKPLQTPNSQNYWKMIILQVLSSTSEPHSPPASAQGSSHVVTVILAGYRTPESSHELHGFRG